MINDEDGVYKHYRKTQTQLMRPYVPGEDLEGVSVNKEDTPSEGGMIAINEVNPEDQWYISAEYFKANYEEVTE